jgi:16S rRNA (guanine527-N7)-methyltransferase
MPTGLSDAQRVLLQTGIEQIGLEISDNAWQQIEKHLALVGQWRNKINLLSIQNEADLITHHALDSLVIVPLLTQSKQVLDIGTGAGFPGLQLACVSPQIEFTLLDSRQRRIEFLRLVAGQAKLRNTQFITARVEDYLSVDRVPAADNPIGFDTLIARAVTSLTHLLKLTAHLRYPGQRLIAMKGIYPQAELEELKRQHGEVINNVHVEKLDVPHLDAQRHAVIIQF